MFLHCNITVVAVRKENAPCIHISSLVLLYLSLSLKFSFILFVAEHESICDRVQNLISMVCVCARFCVCDSKHVNLGRARRSWARWWALELRPSEPRRRPGCRSSLRREAPSHRELLRETVTVSKVTHSYNTVTAQWGFHSSAVPLSKMLVDAQLSSFLIQPTLFFLAA